MTRHRWSRGEKWLTALGVIVAILGIVVGLFVPEIRAKLGLEKPQEPAKVSGPATTFGNNSPANSGTIGTLNNSQQPPERK